VIAPLVRHYLVTDLEAELPLIRKNLTLNVPSWEDDKKIVVEACDWVQLYSMRNHSRERYYSTTSEIDLLLAVDCIFNPALVQPLVSALNHYTSRNKTLVMIMMELRSHEVVQEFLSAWISSATWEIWRIGGELLNPRYVLWVGWKRE
jgi:protein N-lysine methyltransferase METTL21D